MDPRIEADLAALRNELPENLLSRNPVRRALSSLFAFVRALIRTPPGQKITVLPHVQAFADAVQAATGADSFGTYFGHSPTPQQATDIFVPVSSATLGNAIAAFAIENQEKYGVRYVIYRQRIWHRLDPVWRWMEDRGDNTQNHFDHAHLSFETTADWTPEPEPVPVPTLKELPMEFTYITPPEKPGQADEDWIWLGAERIHARTGSGATLEALKGAKQIVALGKVDREVHVYLKGLSQNARFSG